MKRFLSRLLLIVFASTLVMQSAPSAKAAFGISPPWVKHEKLLPGSTFERTITLSTNNPEQDMVVKTAVSGDGNLEKWITIVDQDNLVMRQGQTQFPMKVRVEVPKRAGIKRYKGSIDIRVEPLIKEQRGGVSIALGANAIIDLNVIGDEVVDYKVSSASLQPITEGEDLLLKMNVENLGNVELKELDVEVEIWDQKENNLLKTLTGSEALDSVEAYDSNQIRVRLSDPELEAGSYWARVKAYKEEVAIFETKVFLPVEAAYAAPSVPSGQTAEGISEADQIKDPAIAQPKETETKEVTQKETPEDEQLKPAASEQSNLILYIGIAGIIFGAIALIALSVFAYVFLKAARNVRPPSGPQF